MKTRILVVEDDPALGRVLSDNFTFEGCDVEWVTEGRAAVDALRRRGPDLILLDIGLPDTDGFQLLQMLRGAGQTPIIVLTARGQRADKLEGLRLGADDYVTKPFDVEELMARVKTVLRRSGAPGARLALGDVAIDFAARVATRAGQPVHLTDKEFEILRYLAATRPASSIATSSCARSGAIRIPATRSVITPSHAFERRSSRRRPAPIHPDGSRGRTPSRSVDCDNLRHPA